MEEPVNENMNLEKNRFITKINDTNQKLINV